MNYTEVSQINNLHHDYKVREGYLYYVAKGSNKKLLKLDLNTLEIKSELMDDVNRLKVFGDWAIVEREEGKKLAVYDIKKSRIIQEVEHIHVSLYTFLDNCKMLYQSYDEDHLHVRDLCGNTDEFIMPGTLDYFSTLVGDILLSASGAPFRRYIVAYNIKKQVKEWEFDLHEIGNFYSTV